MYVQYERSRYCNGTSDAGIVIAVPFNFKSHAMWK
jgi:hypothetical protein